MSFQSSDFGVVATGDTRIDGITLDCLWLAFGLPFRVQLRRGGMVFHSPRGPVIVMQEDDARLKIRHASLCTGINGSRA